MGAIATEAAARLLTDHPRPGRPAAVAEPSEAVSVSEEAEAQLGVLWPT